MFRSGDALPVFLVIWLVVPIAFFSFSASKLPGYILPALPAATLLLAEYVRRHVLDDDQRDSVSLSDLRNFPFSVDAQQPTQTNLQAGDPKVELIARDDEVVRPGGFHGTQVLFNLKGDNGLAYTVNQTTLTDTASRLLYTLVIGCEARCYVENAKTINEVVASWTIKEHKR